MIATRFNQIFWGLVLVIFDVKISTFDMLPDFVGYSLVAVGTGWLRAVCPKFAIASTLSCVLMWLSLLEFFRSGHLTTVLTVVDRAIDCIMMWYLLGGVMTVYEDQGRPDLALRATKMRVAYVVLMVVVTIIGYASADTGSATVAVVLVIPLLVVRIMIVQLLRRIRNEISMEDARGQRGMRSVF